MVHLTLFDPERGDLGPSRVVTPQVKKFKGCLGASMFCFFIFNFT